MESPGPSDREDLVALRRILEGTAAETGERFFTALVENLKAAMGTMGAWVAVFEDSDRRLRAISMKMRDTWLDGFSYDVTGTPCQTAVEERRTVHIPDRLVQLYGDFGPAPTLGSPMVDLPCLRGQ